MCRVLGCVGLSSGVLLEVCALAETGGGGGGGGCRLQTQEMVEASFPLL